MKLFFSAIAASSNKCDNPVLLSIWSDEYKRLTWRRIWCALALAQCQLGIVKQEQYDDLSKHQNFLDIDRSLQIELDTKHDLLSEARCFAEQCVIGGGIIHLGATSADIEDNTDALRVKLSLEIILPKLRSLLLLLSKRVVETSGLTTMGYTHLQAAEPTTVGYRLSQYLYDLHVDYEDICLFLQGVKGKGMRGAVGTSASYIELFVDQGLDQASAIEMHSKMDNIVMSELGLSAHPVVTQTYTRKQDLRLCNAISSLASSIYKFCQDFRVLQSSPWSEWYEPRNTLQVGSSAMPFKRNPTTNEAVDSICRIIASLSRTAWDNASNTLLERTLDDGVSRGFILPSILIAIDDVVTKVTGIVDGMSFNKRMIELNYKKMHHFVLTEKLLMLAVKKGANRQTLHEHLRHICLHVMEHMDLTGENNLAAVLANDPEILLHLTIDEIDAVFEQGTYTGNASSASIKLADLVTQSLAM